MKKIFYILVIFMLTATALNAQEICCPEFELVPDMVPCPDKYENGSPYGDQTHLDCEFSACKHTTQNYAVFPKKPGYTYTWVVTGGTAASSTGNPMKVTWGNGNEGSITVFITNQNGTCKDTISVKGCLKDAPVANFSFNPASPVCLNQSVQFTDASVGALSYYWDFGDGTSSTQVNPIHIYTSPGTYNIVLTVSNGTSNSDGPIQETRMECGCKDTITKTITVKGESGITIVPGCKQMLCKGDKASYSTTSNCSNYSWSVTGGHIEGGSNGSSIEVVWDGSYPATVTLNANCGGSCGNSGTLTVPVLYPTMPIAGDNIVCPLDFTTYSLPSMPGTNYAWTISGGGTISGANTDTSIINVQWGNITGNYTITCNYSNPVTKCSGTANIAVQVLPHYKIMGPTKFCVNDAFSFGANGDGNWTISPATGHTPTSFSAGSSINGVWTKPGNYTITATPTTPANFCSYPATINVVVYDTPTLNAIVGPTTICPGSTQLYSVSSNMNEGLFSWSVIGGNAVSFSGNQQESVMIQWNAIGPYQVTVNQTVESCTSADQTLLLNAYPKPVITGPLISCMDNEQIYTATGPAPVGGYIWTLNNALGTIISGQGTNSVTILWHGSMNPPNTCEVTVTTCGGFDMVLVTINAAPPVAITQANSLCSPSGMTLTSSISGASYVWDLDGVTLLANTQTITIQDPGVYTVTVTDANGCKSKGSIVIPEENLVVIASVSTIDKVFWECDETINTNLVATTNLTGLCYQWFVDQNPMGLGTPISGATNANYVATAVGYYWCEISVCGTSCNALTNKVRIIKYTCGGEEPCDPNYTPTITNTNCNPFTFTGTTVPAAAAGSVHWYFGDGDEGFGSTINHQFKYIGDFNVCAEFGNNPYCRKYECKIVSVTIAANFTASVNCDTVSFTDLSQVLAPATITYSWSFPGGSPSSSTLANPPNVIYATGGTHTATVTITDGSCPVSYSVDFITFSVDATINVPSPICAKTQALFTATSSNPNLTYHWDFGDGYLSNLQNTDHAYATLGSYLITLTATDVNGCSKTVTDTITVLPEITASIGGDKYVCPGDTVTLSVTPSFTSYQWFKDGVAIPGATASTYAAGDFGEYWVAVANGDGCATQSNHANVLYYSLPIADIKGKSLQCTNNGPIQIYNSVSETGVTYLWTATGPGTVSFSPNNTVYYPMATTTVPGEYQFKLTVTNANGCVSTDTFCVTLVESPTVTVTAPTGELCEGEAHTFTATASPNINPENYFYQWSNGVQGNTMTTGKPGTYFAMVVNPSGCNATAYAGIIKARPDVSLFPVGCQTLCWKDTLVFPLPTPLPTGAYTVTWFDDDGTAVANVGTGLTLPLSTLQPGIHHLYATVSFSGGCTVTTGILDLTIRDCDIPLPCDNCTGLLDTSSTESSTHTTSNNSAQISNNTITFTILKPVKEVKISLADLKYSWKDPACENCKLKMMERGCLFASIANQSLGTLNPSSLTATNILSGASINECQDELIWKDGTVLQPGTYTIPLQLSLPKPANDKCVLVLDKLCFHLTLIDEDCKVCESIICKKDEIDDPYACDCNDGNNWTSLYLLPSQPGIAVHRDQILCNTTITDIVSNTPYTLSGIYHCNANCPSTVNEITVYDQTNQIIYTRVATAVYESITFPTNGMYSIKLVANCGGTKCVCSFRVNVTSKVEEPEDPEIPDGGGYETPTPETIGEVVDKILPPDFNGGILVSKNDEVLYEKYVSFKDKVTNHTAFDLASITKTFTAMAILKLMEDGKLKIEDAVTKYFPEFPIPEITIKMLLSHRSGLEDYLKFMDESGWDKTKNVTNNDILDFIVKNKSKVLINVPGKVFDYSNTNFTLLALIIEKTSKQSYKDYLSNTFFKPLQMNDTYVLGLDNYATATKSYYKSGKTYTLRYLDLIYGDKDVYSTVQDLKKWDKALRDGKMFKKSTLELAYTPTSSIKPFVSNYGLGWKKIVTTNGNEVLYHTGWWAGSRSILIRLVKENVMIAVVSNNNFTNIAEIKKLCDLFGDYQLSNKKIDNF